MRQNILSRALLAGLVLVGACQEPVKKPAPGRGTYFDVAAFIQTQIAALEKENPVAVKSVTENKGPKENKTLRNLNWQKELAAFAELDLNKPAFRNSYTITRRKAAGGELTETYRKKPGMEGDVDLMVVTRDAAGQVLMIRALRQSNNPLIDTRQEMMMACDNKSGQSHVRTYSIAGSQRPFIFDSLQYVISTQIR